MPKTYKTWEVIKMLTEIQDKNVKFMLGSYELGVDKSGLLSLKYKKESTTIDRNIRITADCDNFFKPDEWTLIQQPVTFMEAINSGKPITSEDGYITNCDPEWILSQGMRLTLEKINGKWFIED